MTLLLLNSLGSAAKRPRTTEAQTVQQQWAWCATVCGSLNHTALLTGTEPVAASH